MALATLSLDASHVLVEVDRSDLVIEALFRTYVGDYTTASNHSQANINGALRGQEDPLLTLDAWPGHAPPVVSWATSCGSLRSSLKSVEVTQAVVSDRETRTTPLDDALRPDQCEEGFSLTVTGDFLLSLWDWTVAIDSQEGRRVVETGLQENGDGTKSAAEAFLFVQDGSLHVDVENPSAFYVRAATVTADTLTLEGARGTIRENGEPKTVTGGDVELHDVRDTRLTGRGVGKALQVEIPASGDLSPSTQTPEVSPLRTPYALVGLAAVATAVALVLALRSLPLVYEVRTRPSVPPSIRPPRTNRERGGVGLRLMAEAAARRGHHRVALLLSRRAWRLFDQQPEVRMLLAECYTALGRHAEALPHYLAASGKWKCDPENRVRALHGAYTCNDALGEPFIAKSTLGRIATLESELARSNHREPIDVPQNGHRANGVRKPSPRGAAAPN